MNFENKGKWFNEFDKSLNWLKESNETDLLEDDELDMIDEGLYVDPDNYGNYDDLVDVIDRNGNPQKMTQNTYNANKDSGDFKDAPKKDDSTQKAFEISDLQKQVASLEQTANKYKSMAMATGKSGRNQQALNMYKLALDKLDGAKAALAKQSNAELNKAYPDPENEIDKYSGHNSIEASVPVAKQTLMDLADKFNGTYNKSKKRVEFKKNSDMQKAIKALRELPAGRFNYVFSSNYFGNGYQVKPKDYNVESAQKNEAKIVNMSNACSMQNISHLSDEQMAIQYKVPVDAWKRAKALFKSQQSSTYGNKPKDFVNFDTMKLESLQRRNEVRYIDPFNLDKYDKDEIEEVTKADGTKAYKRKSTSAPAMQAKPAQQNKDTVNSPQQKEQAVQEKNSLTSDFIRLKGKRDSLAQENRRIGKQAKDANNYPTDAQKKVIGNQKKIDALEKEMSMKKARIDELDKAISSYKDPEQLNLF